uniref:Uncharacterized protein n=1 Tax=Brassica campestris TaxID=3711 RepID=A0A3P5YB50_BRACM|nr:unnamed protein product [Brassica rapa]
MTSWRDRMSSSPPMMRFMKALMPWVCKRTSLGVSMLMVLKSLLLFSKEESYPFATVLM